MFVQNYGVLTGSAFYYRADYKELNTIVADLVKKFAAEEIQQQEIPGVVVNMFERRLMGGAVAFAL